jgi:hypothetical protein
MLEMPDAMPSRDEVGGVHVLVNFKEALNIKGPV